MDATQSDTGIDDDCCEVSCVRRDPDLYIIRGAARHIIALLNLHRWFYRGMCTNCFGNCAPSCSCCESSDFAFARICITVFDILHDNWSNQLNLIVKYHLKSNLGIHRFSLIIKVILMESAEPQHQWTSHKLRKMLLTYIDQIWKSRRSFNATRTDTNAIDRFWSKPTNIPSYVL